MNCTNHPSPIRHCGTHAGLLFDPGALSVTVAAWKMLEALKVDPWRLVPLHCGGHWLHMRLHDQAANCAALRDGGRILTSYPLDSGAHVWLVTCTNPRTTTIQLPGEL